MVDITPNACMQGVGASAMVWVDDVIDENTTNVHDKRVSQTSESATFFPIYNPKNHKC